VLDEESEQLISLNEHTNKYDKNFKTFPTDCFAKIPLKKRIGETDCTFDFYLKSMLKLTYDVQSYIKSNQMRMLLSSDKMFYFCRYSSITVKF